MGFAARHLLALASVFALASCEGHLPPLETSPNYPGPKIVDVVNNIQCELAKIVDTSISEDDSYTSRDARLVERIKSNEVDFSKNNNLSRLLTLVPYLVKYNFVASVQLTLEVTDTEGLSPSLAFINKAATLTSTVDGQVNGTQDRSLTINYVIDLASLKNNETKYCLPTNNGLVTDVTEGIGLSGGIAGDLGIADIVSDGLLSVDTTGESNIYGNSGPVPPTFERSVSNFVGSIKPSTDAPSIPISSLNGALVFSPQSATSSTQGTVSFSGIVKLGPTKVPYIASLTGSIVPPDSVGGDVYFSLSGNLVPAASADTSFVKSWGFSPAITLAGSINDRYQVSTLNLAGSMTPSGGTESKAATITLAASHAGGGGAPKASSKTGSSSASASSGGTTSFGSTVDFSVVFGLNGGPSWTFKQFKGPGVSSSLITVGRTSLDTLNITFVPACQVWSDGATPAIYKSFWDTIPSCDIPGATQQGSSAAYQANSVMILKSLLQRPGAPQ